MTDEESRWIRKATDLERMFEIGHQYGVYLTHYTLDLATAKPIDEGFMMRCLQHLYRQVPVLRVCLQERNSELWLREMEECSIDLKIIEGGILEDEREKLTLHTYSAKEGPLWCVRLISEVKVSREDKDFSYNYWLIFGVHHSISDGTTNVKICSQLCNIMDTLLGGQSVDDEHQLGDITSEEETLSLYEEEKKILRVNPELCVEIKRELTEAAKVKPLIRHICIIPKETPVLSRDVSVVFDATTSEKFHKKAKSNGVNLHAALTGVINLALIKLLEEHGITKDQYNFQAGHDIDIRRYFSGNSTRALGMNGPTYMYQAPFWAPKDMLSRFWETVKKFHEKLHADIASRKVIKTSAYRFMNEDLFQNFSELFRADAEPNYYYTVSNMGNLDQRLYKGGNFVCVRKLTRFCSIRSIGSFMVIFIHTFNNQLNINFTYSTKFLTHGFVCRLRDICQESMLAVCDI